MKRLGVSLLRLMFETGFMLSTPLTVMPTALLLLA